MFTDCNALLQLTSHKIDIDHSSFAELISYLERSSINLSHVTSLEMLGELSHHNVQLVIKLLSFFSELKTLELNINTVEDFALEILKKNLQILPKKIKNLVFHTFNVEFEYEVLKNYCDVEEISFILEKYKSNVDYLKKMLVGEKIRFTKLQKIHFYFHYSNPIISFDTFIWFASNPTVKFITW